MAIEKGSFENLSPSRFITFTFPNPYYPLHIIKTLNFYGEFLRIAVLDSPLQPTPDPKIAAMLVPIDREDDWIFSTENGHLQLLSNSPGITRLILVGNLAHSGDFYPNRIYNRPIRDDTYFTKFEECLIPLLFALSPKTAFKYGLPQIPFLSFEDSVVRSVSVERCVGTDVGEMLIEDVEIHSDDKFEKYPLYRRRLRFKRMPNLVQTEIAIVPVTISDTVDIRFGETEFRPDTCFLVHPYLSPMVASLSLIAPYLEERIRSGNAPRILCVGVGGGALLAFLGAHFGFQVLGVEKDETVLRVAKRYFGLIEDELLRVSLGDGIELIQNFAKRTVGWDLVHNEVVGDYNVDGGEIGFEETNVQDFPIDVIMIDLDSGDARDGLSAPPLECVQKHVLVAARSALSNLGILVINVIPRIRSFYENMVCEFRQVFSEIYEVDVGNGENYVLVATASPIESVADESESYILKKLKQDLVGLCIDRIRKI